MNWVWHLFYQLYMPDPEFIHTFIDRPHRRDLLQFISQYAAFDEIHTLLVIVARDNEHIPFALVKNIQPIQLSHQCILVSLQTLPVLPSTVMACSQGRQLKRDEKVCV